MKNAITAVILYCFIVVLCVFLIAASISNFRASGTEGEKRVNIPQGMIFDKIKDLLHQENVISSPLVLDIAIHLKGGSRDLKAGDYTFNGTESYFEIIEILQKGQVSIFPVTIPEGLSLMETCRLLEGAGVTDGASLLEEFEDISLIAGIDGEALNLEGYLFPDTYFLSPGSDAVKIASVLVSRFKSVFRREWAVRAEELGMTVRQVVTLASMIEKETASVGERELISSVFHNRMKKGMLLQCDPTVIYALTLEGIFDGNLRKDDLKFDSSYNTYMYKGLPPGPIANPGEGSLKAALYPAEGDYLYFVSKNDGTHYFSKSLNEHNKAVNTYQKAYWRSKWQQGR